MPDLFPDIPAQISIDVQIEEVKREIRQRDFVYARAVDRGSMKPEEARRYVARMKAVLSTLEQVKLCGFGAGPKSQRSAQ